MKRIAFFLLSLTALSSCRRPAPGYLLVRQDTTQQRAQYVFMSPGGDTVRRLDTAKYYVCFSDTVRAFAIVGIKGRKSWWAIDRDEKPLFQVYNTSDGEPTPDELRYGMIRIVDDKGRIGFANDRGKVVISPRFEAASNFYRDKAIIGGSCKKVLWCCEGENSDKHYMIDCKQAGFIDRSGRIRKMGAYSFEEMEKLSGWKPDQD
ncbi:WG repeat-containing protein [Hufsiella ginkgonis]|uniref:WG repeat-containing protein n=1 Tax=Hufsiella ginkgonis TaxID=2695274 RepID=A0A7K1XU12_9SPHI|nr:WG repeat-containing protein [Hufsiella ginkgonis]MXV14298.1 hypothetical protein [Hufsiella ginkgonis]